MRYGEVPRPRRSASLASRLVALLKRGVRRSTDRVVRTSSVVGDRVREELPAALFATPAVTAKYQPEGGERTTALIAPPNADRAVWHQRDLAVPPPKLWSSFEESATEYLASGQADVATMREMLHESGYTLEQARRVLDFGCGAGRLTRWLADLADGREIWGADISGPCITWCSQHLSPPFNFVTTTTFPYLPFPDESFDVVLAGNVFSNLADLETAWLLEIRRVLAPDGRFYVTINDRNSISRILAFPRGHKLHWFAELLSRAERDTAFLERSWARFSINPGTRAIQVFHDLAHLPATWGRLFEIRVTREDALQFQAGVVLERPPPAARARATD